LLENPSKEERNRSLSGARKGENNWTPRRRLKKFSDFFYYDKGGESWP